MNVRTKLSATLTASLFAAVSALVLFSVAAHAAGGPGVMIAWKAPNDVAASEIKGYRVYRSENVTGHYDRLGEVPADKPSYEDRGGDPAAPDGLVRGRMYFYRVTTVFKSGAESRPTNPVGMVAGADQGAREYTLPEIKHFTSDSLGKVNYLRETMTFILSGTPGLSAWFSIVGVTGETPMKEVKPGTYKGEYTVPEGASYSGAKAAARLVDTAGGKAAAETPAELNLIGWKRPGLTGLYAGMVEADRVGLNWPRYQDTGGGTAIFRGTSPIVGTEDLQPVSGIISGGVYAYIDTTVSSGTTYYYVLGLLDNKGRLAEYTDNLKVTVPDVGKVSGIGSVTEDSGGRTLVPGDVLNVAMATAPGGKATFSVGDAAKDIDMREAEPGVYRGSYTVAEGDGVFRSKVSVSLREPDGKTRFSSSSTLVSLNAPRQAGGKTAGRAGSSPSAYAITDNILGVAGVSGRLTAGKTFTVTMTGDPGKKAYFNVGEAIWKVPMNELPDTPGTYVGEYTVKPGDNAGTSGDPAREVYVTGYLESDNGNQSEPITGAMPVVVDTTCNIAVEVSDTRLSADTTSQARVTFTVTDADGEPVRDRRLTMLLEPPPRYSGVVGSGGVLDWNGQETSDADLGRLQLDFDDLTDSSGQVGATYTSGFAAKTAMIVARDYSTGSVGIGYVTAEISTSVSIALEGPKAALAAMALSGPAYQLTLEVIPEATISSASLTRFMAGRALTADGRSRATVVATLTQDGIPVEGKRIIFAVSGAGGGLTAPGALTDGSGRAQVFYIAGKTAGMSLITATEAETGTSASAAIMLLADAPAKIFASATPESLPADGVSGSEIMVGVMDINNNPTEGIRLSYDIRSGSGMLSDGETITGPDGGSRVYYTAGTEPGVATIYITAASEPPTAEELENAANSVNAPMIYDFNDRTELRLLKWYRSAGEMVGRGEPLALVETPNGEMKVYSPVTGTLDQIKIEQGIYVMEGREIGIVVK